MATCASASRCDLRPGPTSIATDARSRSVTSYEPYIEVSTGPCFNVDWLLPLGARGGKERPRAVRKPIFAPLRCEKTTRAGSSAAQKLHYLTGMIHNARLREALLRITTCSAATRHAGSQGSS